MSNLPEEMRRVRKFRDRRKQEEDDDIIKGKLPAGFADENNKAISHAEALSILSLREHAVQTTGAPELPLDKEVIRKCQDHLITFQGTVFVGENAGQQANAIRNEILDSHHDLGLTDFEISQIFNLRPSSIEEAVVLITSLERFDSEAEKSELWMVLRMANPKLRNIMAE